MATVTGYTSAKMKQIEDTTVVDGDIVGNDLILTTRAGTQINAGNVRGPIGPIGPPGEVTEAELAAAIAGAVPDGSITTAKLANGAVTALKLANDSVGAAQIQANAVGTSEILDNAITAEKIAANAVTGQEIADGVVSSTKLSDDAVTSAKIADGAVFLQHIDLSGIGGSIPGRFLKYFKMFGFVFVCGAQLTPSTTTGTLPVGYRPNIQVPLPGINEAGQAVRVVIGVDGVINTGGGASLVSFTGFFPNIY